MKSKKTIIYCILAVILIGTFSSCGIDKKCPAYSQATTDTTVSVA